MRWSRQLRWKLFVSHTIVIVVAVVVLLLTTQLLTRSAVGEQSPFTVGADPGVTGELTTPSASAAGSRGPLAEVFEEALLIASFGALAAAVVVSLFVSRRIVEPLQELTEVSRRLALGYYRERTQIRSDDELAQLSQSINQLAEALDRTEQRRLALIADVAHELRTPLTTIEGYMEGMLDGVIAADPQTFSTVQREAARLRRLAEELALLSRAEAGELSVIPRPFQIDTLVHDLVTRFQQQFDACEVALHADVPPDLPQVNADPDRMSQVLINLLSNALRYTPAGGTVRVTVLPLDDVVQISVADSGIGIGAEHLPHIFERFYRVDKSRARTSGGTGIGLTIARHLIYAHGGDIWAESDGLGKGATFYVTLPVYAPAFEVRVAEAPETQMA